MVVFAMLNVSHLPAILVASISLSLNAATSVIYSHRNLVVNEGLVQLLSLTEYQGTSFCQYLITGWTNFWCSMSKLSMEKKDKNSVFNFSYFFNVVIGKLSRNTYVLQFLSFQMSKTKLSRQQVKQCWIIRLVPSFVVFQ